MHQSEIDLSDTESVARHITCSDRLLPRLFEFASSVVEAYAIVRRFASDNGWLDHMEKPLFTSVHIFETRDELWCSIDREEERAEGHPPTSGLSAGIISGCLMAVTPEEYTRVWPEYALIDKAWTRLLAHEIAHQLHVRIVGAEERMGPKWFYEGFAMHVAGQRFGHAIATVDNAVEAMRAESRGSYAKYIATFEFFLKHIELALMLRRAADPSFEDWLSARTPEKNDCL